MDFQRKIFLGLILAFVSVCRHHECASYRQLSQRGHGSEGQPEAAKLARIKLSRSTKLDSLETLSRSLDIFRERDGQTTSSIDLNSLLVGSVGIGKPVQEFRFVIDTTSPLMWVASVNCTNCGNKRRYNSSASTTYTEDGTPVKTDEEAGFISIDQISLGNTIVKNQSFIEMTKLAEVSVSSPYDGLLSLGYKSANPLQQMVDQKLIDHAVFSIYQNAKGGEIVFGGVDEKHFVSPINWVKNADKSTWSFNMDRITLKHKADPDSEDVTVCSKGCKADIYSSLPYIIGPLDQVQKINEALGAELSGDIFIMPDCDLSKLSNLVLTINSEEYEIKPEQYIVKAERDGKEICISSFLPLPLFNNEWFIGSSIIGHIYTAFDFENESIGFAHSK